MLAVDTNILVYAHRREAREFEVASQFLGKLASGPTPWGIPWPCAYEFFSVVTNPRIWKERASSPAQAWAQLETWFAAPGLRLLGETSGFSNLLAGFVNRPRVRGSVVHDARSPPSASRTASKGSSPETGTSGSSPN